MCKVLGVKRLFTSIYPIILKLVLAHEEEGICKGNDEDG
jgi:hypothetical protein